MIQIVIFFIFGLVLAYIFKSYNTFEGTYYQEKQFKDVALTEEAIAQSELGLFVALVAKVAKADGKVHELEAELVSNMLRDASQAFNQSEDVREILKSIFNREKDLAFNVEDIASQLYRNIASNKSKAIMMLQFLTHLSFIDGELSVVEERLLLKIASLLHLEEYVIKEIIEHFSSLSSNTTGSISIEQAYNILGVNKDASLTEVKKAYRKLVREYHPDIMQAKGESESYIKEATQKVQEINAAYEIIKSRVK